MKRFLILTALTLTYYTPVRGEDTPTQEQPIQPLQIAELLPPLEELNRSLQAHFHQLQQALIEEFNYKQRGKLLKFLPSFSYNFLTQSPHLSYNSPALYSAINDQHLKKAKIRSIKRYMHAKRQEQIAKLHRHYADLEAEVQFFNQTLDLYHTKAHIFAIQQQLYQNLEMAPIEFLKSQVIRQEQELRLHKQRMQIQKLRNHILEIAKTATII